MDELKQIRQKIDVIDEKIVKLLSNRFEFAQSVAIYKKKNKLKTTQANREKEILDMLTRQDTSLSPVFIKKLYSLIFKESKRIQKQENEKTI